MLSWNGLVKKIIWGDWINQPKVLSGEVEVEGHSQSRRKRGGTGKATVLTEGTEAHSPDGADKPVYRVNKDGRYICQTCEKTFKTVSCTAPVLSVDIDLRMNPYRLSLPCLVWKKVMISKLSAILFFPCLCSIKQTYFSMSTSRQTSWEPIWSPTVRIRISPASSVGVPSAPKAPWFVTIAVTQVQWTGRGRAQNEILLHVTYAASFPISIISLSPSLPPDERPYRCNLCGLSFRESGALTRHLKSITPCTEKIRFNQYKEILVSKDGQQKGSSLSKDWGIMHAWVARYG